MQDDKVYVWPTEWLKIKLPEIKKLKFEIDTTMNLVSYTKMADLISRTYRIYFMYLQERIHPDIEEIFAIRIDGETKLYVIKREAKDDDKVEILDQEFLSEPLKELTELLIPEEVLEDQSGWSVHANEI